MLKTATPLLYVYNNTVYRPIIIIILFAGNPWPAVIQNQTDTSKWINNILLESARKNLGQERIKEALDIDRTEADITKSSETPAL